MFAIFFKGVDGHDGEIGVIFGICGEVEVDHFFHDLVVGEGGSAHFWEDGRGIHTEGHVADDFFDDLSSFFVIVLIDDVVECAVCNESYFLS